MPEIILRDSSSIAIRDYISAHVHDDGHVIVFRHSKVEDEETSSLIMLRPEEAEQLAKAILDK